MRSLILSLTISLLSYTAQAKDGQELSSFQQLCVASDAVGFNWDNGEYKKTRFKRLTYTVTKVEPEKGSLPDLMCNRMREDKSTINNSDSKSYLVCLRLGELGGGDPSYHPCKEYHLKLKDKPWRVTLQCENDEFMMSPNEHFHKARVHANTRSTPEDDYKDSLVLTVGKCSSIKQ